MENAVCAFCGKNNTKKWCESEGLDVVKCSCGMIYPNPRLSADEISRGYNSNRLSGVDDYLEVAEGNKHDFRKRFDFIEKYSHKGDMLDVGCNIGSAMDVAESRGWVCSGIDVNKKAVQVARKKGLNARAGQLEDSKGFYDLIFMNDVVEHVANPRKELGLAKKLLREDGVLYISAPDGGSLMAGLSRGRWLHLKPRQHLYIFNRRNLRMMLEEEGFEVLYLSSVGRTRKISTIVKKNENLL
ncbi:MAG: hypothetical protein B6U72_02870 [Candidatus Altiarchaeales archaeon ex4484_2]|nr:MAG: hypothetical protein B6U72_02870 [Candidatus Altiarchaeales archaeon ex4484_2]